MVETGHVMHSRRGRSVTVYFHLSVVTLDNILISMVDGTVTLRSPADKAFMCDTVVVT